MNTLIATDAFHSLAFRKRPHDSRSVQETFAPTELLGRKTGLWSAWARCGDSRTPGCERGAGPV